MFGERGCIVAGFIMYFLGTMGIYISMCVSLERFYIIHEPMRIRKMSNMNLWLMISFSALFSLLWCVFPLLGWSKYAPEGAGTSCSVEWMDRSWNVISYNVAMFIFVFFLPLGVIVFTHVKIMKMVKMVSVVFLVFFSLSGENFAGIILWFYKIPDFRRMFH